MAERIPEGAREFERERVCGQLHFLGLLCRGRPLMHPGSPRAPGDLVLLSSVAAQPDNPSRVAREGRVSTEEFAAGLAELEDWCRAHGLDTFLRAAASRSTEPVLMPVRSGGRG